MVDGGPMELAIPVLYSIVMYFKCILVYCIVLNLLKCTELYCKESYINVHEE